MTQTEKNSLAGLLASAVQAIETLLSMPPQTRGEVVDASERAIVRVRDELIERYREGQDEQGKEKLHAALDQVNIAVSLMTGVEYPAAGIQEKAIQQARDIMIGINV